MTRLAALIIRLHYVQLGATTAARYTFENSAGTAATCSRVSGHRWLQRRDWSVGGTHIKDGDFGGQIPMEDDEGNEDANTRILEAEDEVETGEMNQVGPGWG